MGFFRRAVDPSTLEHSICAYMSNRLRLEYNQGSDEVIIHHKINRSQYDRGAIEIGPTSRLATLRST